MVDTDMVSDVILIAAMAFAFLLLAIDFIESFSLEKIVLANRVVIGVFYLICLAMIWLGFDSIIAAITDGDFFTSLHLTLVIVAIGGFSYYALRHLHHYTQVLRKIRNGEIKPDSEADSEE